MGIFSTLFGPKERTITVHGTTGFQGAPQHYEASKFPFSADENTTTKRTTPSNTLGEREQELLEGFFDGNDTVIFQGCAFRRQLQEVTHMPGVKPSLTVSYTWQKTDSPLPKIPVEDSHSEYVVYNESGESAGTVEGAEMSRVLSENTGDEFFPRKLRYAFESGAEEVRTPCGDRFVKTGNVLNLDKYTRTTVYKAVRNQPSDDEVSRFDTSSGEAPGLIMQMSPIGTVFHAKGCAPAHLRTTIDLLIKATSLTSLRMRDREMQELVNAGHIKEPDWIAGWDGSPDTKYDALHNALFPELPENMANQQLLQALRYPPTTVSVDGRVLRKTLDIAHPTPPALTPHLGMTVRTVYFQ